MVAFMLPQEGRSVLLDFLWTIPMFGGLELVTLERILDLLRREEHPVGSEVVREGEAGRSLYVVRSGTIGLYQRGSGPAPVLLARLGTGDSFGEMAIIDIQPRSATALAEQPSILYTLTNEDLYALYVEDMPGYVMVIQNLCRELSRRLRRANARITDLASRAAEKAAEGGEHSRQPSLEPSALRQA